MKHSSEVSFKPSSVLSINTTNFNPRGNLSPSHKIPDRVDSYWNDWISLVNIFWTM